MAIRSPPSRVSTVLDETALNCGQAAAVTRLPWAGALHSYCAPAQSIVAHTHKTAHDTQRTLRTRRVSVVSLPPQEAGSPEPTSYSRFATLPRTGGEHRRRHAIWSGEVPERTHPSALSSCLMPGTTRKHRRRVLTALQGTSLGARPSPTWATLPHYGV